MSSCPTVYPSRGREAQTRFRSRRYFVSFDLVAWASQSASRGSAAQLGQAVESLALAEGGLVASTDKLAILVGGGPAPGINSVIGAATIRSVLEGVEVVGIKDGFEGIMQDRSD